MFIELKNAVKRYGKGETEVYALDHAELSLEQGKICVILGYSGGNTEGSIIYKIGSVIEPVTHIFGLKWQAFAAFIASAVSKEATMGVLSSLYANTGDILGSTLALKGSTYSTDTLATILPQVMTKAEALAFIVACSFNMPCVMALSATAKEVHSVKWTAKIALFYTVMSLVLAGITYQIANIFL